MGRKKGKNRQNRAAPTPLFRDLGSPNLVEVKNPNLGSEVEIPSNFSLKEPTNNPYKTVYLSGEDVNASPNKKTENERRGSRSSSYHDLIDGGAYNSFRASSRSSLHINPAPRSSMIDMDGAGDRVIAGSRSISHRSLFNDDRSFGVDIQRNPSKISLAGSKMSIEWDDEMMGTSGGGGRVSRRDSIGGRDGGGGHQEEEAMLYFQRKPFVRSRTVSSGGSTSHNNNNNNHQFTSSTSHHALNSMDNDDVRTYHAGSEYLQNRLSKLSIHSNNDEFVLVGGHPPPQPIPRVRSRVSMYSQQEEERGGGSEKGGESMDDLLGKSISQQSLTEIDGRGRGGHVSRSSSRFTVGTSSNTDDRLLLAAQYSQSPEAEGLIHSHHHHPVHNHHHDRSSSRSSSRIGFVEIPTLYSHPDEKFDDPEPGEPYRPTSEHSSTPTAPSSRTRLFRSDPVAGGGFSSSSNSSLHSREIQPPRALLVTSALTPVVPKRNGAAPMSQSHSEESLIMKTPQTVQRVTSSEHKSLRQQDQEAAAVKRLVETAVQTGNSIRLRQNQRFEDVLSECAYLPAPMSMSPTSTTSYIPYPLSSSSTVTQKGSTVTIPRATGPPSAKEGSEVEIPKSSNSISARLRHISDIYSTTDTTTTDKTRKSEDDVTRFFKKSSEEIVVPIQKAPKSSSIGSSSIEIPIETTGKDTIRKHIPRGRIRDLATAFDKMTGGSPARPLEFKSQVHIPRGFQQNPTATMTTNPMKSTTTTDGSLWSMKKAIGGEVDSNTDIRMSSPTSIGNRRLSNNHLNGSSSSSAFRSSTTTIRSQEDSRRRSTSSGLQPHVFTRNTFLTSSVIKPGDKSQLPANVAMTTNYTTDPMNTGFVSTLDDLEKSKNHQDFSEYSRKVVEVPISGKIQRKQRNVTSSRAKTQEIPGTFEFESSRFTESRANSGDLNQEFGAMQKPLFSAAEAFGRDTAEDLRAKQENWPPIRPSQHHWTTTTSTSEFHHLNETKNTNSVSSPIYHHHMSTDKEIHIPSNHQPTQILHQSNIRKVPAPAPSTSTSTARRMSMSSSGGNPMMTRHHHPYSPPATEDAGSRITHHTSQTLQSEDLLGTEDSSIRGKIDRMFDFVTESDDSRKKTTIHNLDNESTETIGTNGVMSPHHHHHQNSLMRQNWNNGGLIGSGGQIAAEMPQALKPRQEPKLKSPERRATVTVPELEYYDNDLEYSLSQYREMQREQLRRRLPSSEDPQFFRSPGLSAPHAGQSMHVYRTKDLMGTPTAGEKFRFPSSSSGIRGTPVALATSTPVESPSGRQQSSTFSINNNNNINFSNQNLEVMIPPNDTFVSSISGVSAPEKHADVMKKINRLSYMIENTQKQMTMNEAALSDAVKKGRRSQEIAAHRSILISRETLRLQRQELRRLHAFSAVRRPPPPVAKELRGAVVFKNLIVHLNKLFVSRLTIKDDNSYSFVALFKFGHQVEATELVPLRFFEGEETCDKLFFVKQIQFSDVPVDFNVSIEIYAMFQRIPAAKPAELSLGSTFANKCKSLMGPPQKKSQVPLETAFKFRGRLILDRDAQGERCLYLDDVTYPLEGTVMITTQCSRLPEAFEIDFRGFLTMFHTISQMASWERYWAVLRRGIVLFWKYPDDEQMGREPKMQIDLTKCTNNSIEKCGFDLCPRANSFAIEILVDADDAMIGGVVEKKRVLLSADTSEMLSQWLFTLNQTLDVIRGPI